MLHDTCLDKVCDAGTWTVEEADLVCRQLGFSRGVKKTTQVRARDTQTFAADHTPRVLQGLVHGPVSQSARATEVVECGGGEAELEQCRHAHRGEGGVECKLDQDIVAVSCVYDSLAACKPR